MTHYSAVLFTISSQDLKEENETNMKSAWFFYYAWEGSCIRLSRGRNPWHIFEKEPCLFYGL